MQETVPASLPPAASAATPSALPRQSGGLVRSVGRGSAGALQAVGRFFLGWLRHPFRLLALLGLLALIGVGIGLSWSQLWAWHHFRAGRTCLERHHSEEAAAHFRACLEVWPHDRDALLLAARAAWRIGAFDEAEHLLGRYEQIAGQDERLDLERALLTAARGEVDAVSRWCDAQLDQDHPAAPLMLEALTAGCLRMYRIPEAGGYIKRWQELDPDNPQAYLMLARLYDLMSQVDESVAAYRKAVELDPENDGARLHLAAALLDRHRPQEALTHLDYLRQRLPDNPAVGLRLAQCKEYLREPDEAVALLDEVLARHPHHGPALVQRAKLELARPGADLGKAEAWLKEGVARDPSDYQARHQLRLCLERAGKHAEAQEQQRRLEAMNRDMERLSQITREEMGRRPHDPALQCEVGAILVRAGAFNEGARWLQQALKEDPGYRPAHEALADLYQRTGNPGLAARHREQARSAARP
ncbi:MAG TPA: tetratricopeptide repeat protein [Gemmataceae bacterium]|nr:tetratricopeptide repeat protein [Gemmataceae bacterium]